MSEIKPPAAKPCTFCPYRTDVPSGIWESQEYAKLRQYDRQTPYQPVAVFLCHLNDADSDRSRVCAGWAGCHDGEHLLALRLHKATGALSPDVAEAVRAYTTPVPLFSSGTEAADHGEAEVTNPGRRAITAAEKISRRRNLENQ